MGNAEALRLAARYALHAASHWEAICPLQLAIRWTFGYASLCSACDAVNLPAVAPDVVLGAYVGVGSSLRGLHCPKGEALRHRWPWQCPAEVVITSDWLASIIVADQQMLHSRQIYTTTLLITQAGLQPTCLVDGSYA